jgi:hypothetical protein
MSRKTGDWSASQDDTLRAEYAAGKSLADIAFKLCKTERSVRSRRARLRLRRGTGGFVFWSDQKNVDFVRDNWRTLSVRKMAKELGISLGSLIGKAFRMGLCEKGHSPMGHNTITNNTNSVSRPRRRRGSSLEHQSGPTELGSIPTPPSPPPLAITCDVSMSPMAASLISLAAGTCRFPQSDQARFCGEPQRPGSSYCAHHHEQCHDERPALSPKERALRSYRARRQWAERRAALS